LVGFRLVRFYIMENHFWWGIKSTLHLNGFGFSFTIPTAEPIFIISLHFGPDLIPCSQKSDQVDYNQFVTSGVRVYLTQLYPYLSLPTRFQCTFYIFQIIFYNKLACWFYMVLYLCSCHFLCVMLEG
jgi:hypothetical protein